jgi:hypothetical protein
MNKDITNRKAFLVKSIFLVIPILTLVAMPAKAIVSNSGKLFSRQPAKIVLPDIVPAVKSGDYTANSFNIWPPNGGWMINPASGDGAWQQGSLDMGSGVSPDSGGEGTLNFAEFDCWDYASGVAGDIISPQITLPNPADVCSLSFYVWNHSNDIYNSDSLLVQISTDGGSNWSDFTTVNGDIDSWTYRVFALGGYDGQSINIRFRAKSDYGGSNLAIDQVRIGQRPVHDVCPLRVVCPGLSMSGPASPEVVVANNSSTTESFEVICSIDSAGTQVYADSKIVTSLASGAQQLVTFGSYAPAIGNGNIYRATFNTVLAGDGDSNNDTLSWSFNTYSVQRTVLGMDFTALWCTYCPWHQVAWEMLKDEVGDSLCTMGLHSSSSGDSFYVAHCADLKTYYSASTALPTSMMDGIYVWSGTDTSGAGVAQYNIFRAGFDKRKTIKSPFSIDLAGTYNGSTGILSVTTDYPGTIPIPVNVRVAIVELSKYNPWQVSGSLPQDSLYDIVRDVMPASAGDTFNVTGGTVTRNYPFTINAGWNTARLSFIAWAESRGLKENLQAGEIGLSELTGVSGHFDQPVGLAITKLLPCYPNPGSDQLTFKYILGETGPADLKIYDICGRLVRTLSSGVQEAGQHAITWDVDKNLANGIYLYKLTSRDHSSVKKLTILR